jgi:hypothetical protein
MSHPTIVPSLRIHAASGPTLYPDEGGYSSAWGEVDSNDAALTDLLDQSMHGGSAITLRCGLLEVAGTIIGRDAGSRGTRFRIRLQGLRYGSP